MAKPNADLLNAMLLAPHTLTSQIEAVNARIDDIRIGEQALIGTNRAIAARQAMEQLLSVRLQLKQVKEQLVSIDLLERYVGGEIASPQEPPSGEQP